MTNITKWFVAVPFTIVIAFGLPALAAGDPAWFIGHWAETLYVGMCAGMWLAATAFVDVNRPRSSADLANRLIPVGLILSVPISVWDRTFWIASSMPLFVNLSGVLISTVAIILGLAARFYLGRSYSPRSNRLYGSSLVREGPYRWIRHPLYAAAILWIVGWPLIIASFVGSILTIGFVLPAVFNRIRSEESELLQFYGVAYRVYCERTWRLFPFIF
jgi:protein-S-isoprenylcysteine O-methyltransferase Ste14